MGFPRLATIEGQAPKDVTDAIRSLLKYSGGLDKRIDAIEKAGPRQLTPKQLVQVRQALEVTGSTPININNLFGAGSAVTVGLHAARVVASASQDGAAFYETDRQQLYVASAGAWLWADGEPFYCLAVNLPTDLGPNDAGFPAWGIDTGLLYVFSGNIFHKRAGILTDVIANRPVAFTGTDAGLIFRASDQGYQAWRLDYTAGAWVLLRGLGDPMAVTLNPNTKPALGANDAGFRIAATDFDRLYEWSGAAWADYAGQPTRGMYIDFQGAVPATNGWVAADGALHANGLSTAAGGVANITPNNVAGFYVRV